MDAQFASGALTGGALHALEDAYTNLLNEATATSYPSQLNVLAQSLHDAVNAPARARRRPVRHRGRHLLRLHRRRPARPVRPAGSRCRAAILADPTKIAAGAAGQGPGSATNANAMVALQNAITTGGTTFLDYYNGLQSGLGTATQSTARSLDAQQIVVGGLSDRRVAASGVSLDEEMTNMIKFQHAYARRLARAQRDGREPRPPDQRHRQGRPVIRTTNNQSAVARARRPPARLGEPAGDAAQALDRQGDQPGRGRPGRRRPRDVPALQVSDVQQYQKNINEALGLQDASESAMSSVADIMKRAKELVVQAGNGTLDQTGLNNIAAEIKQLVEAGARVDERHLRRPLPVQRHGHADAAVPEPRASPTPATTT